MRELIRLCVAVVVSGAVAAPLAGQAAPDRWELRFEQRIGDTGEDFLTWIHDLRVAGDTVYVLQRFQQHVALYDRDGTPAGRIGRRGQGPGELSNPTALGWHGHQLWVTDGATGAISVFDRTGRFSHRVTPPDYPSATQVFRPLGLLADGSVLGRSLASNHAIAAGEAPPSRLLRPFPDDGTVQVLDYFSPSYDIAECRDSMISGGIGGNYKTEGRAASLGSARSSQLRASPASAAKILGPWVALAFFLFPLDATMIEAQRVIEIADPPICDRCSLVLQRVVTLAPPHDSVGFRSLAPPSVARSPEGYYFVGPTDGLPVIAIFDPTGRYVGGYGGVGGGPREFRGQPQLMLLRFGQDSLYAFEGIHVHILHVEAGAVREGRKIRMDLRANDAIVLGRTPVVQWPIWEPHAGGTVIQILTEDGKIERGVGVHRSHPMSRSSPFSLYRRIGRAQGRRAIWSAHLNRYEVSRIRYDGIEDIRVVRTTHWFTPYEDFIEGELFIVPQRPRIEAIIEPTSGLLWVMITHESEDFHPLDLAGGTEGRVNPYIDFNGFLDTTLEVLDLRAGVALARTKVAQYLRPVSTFDDVALFYTLRESQTGDFELDIFEGRLDVQ